MMTVVVFAVAQENLIPLIARKNTAAHCCGIWFDWCGIFGLDGLPEKCLFMLYDYLSKVFQRNWFNRIRAMPFM